MSAKRLPLCAKLIGGPRAYAREAKVSERNRPASEGQN